MPESNTLTAEQMIELTQLGDTIRVLKDNGMQEYAKVILEDLRVKVNEFMPGLL
jgi:hypothetical protein